MVALPRSVIGPVLILDGIEREACHLSALFISDGTAVAPIDVEGQPHSAEILATYDGVQVLRARFSVPAGAPSGYFWNGQRFDLAPVSSPDLRIAFVSCNGEEHGDLDREDAERNAMWGQLGEEHRRAPFALLLHGGDQVYADEATHGHPLSEDWPRRVPKDPTTEELEALRHHLRAQFLARYVWLYAAPDFAWIAARVPSLMQWDDHDICDGWGSLTASRLHSGVGQVLFQVAREACLVFQHAARDGDLPGRFHDPDGTHLSWAVRMPGLRILAPDLRGERTRRNILGAGGWDFMDGEAAPMPGQTLLMSSVPLLGPRLSILEMVINLVPAMQKYEDDLRDQWQSRAHRAEWQRMLRLVRAMVSDQGGVTALSGEIHLAT
ncbi:MAG: alkaline phosphatase D family protein, partial [Pseudomonadota bacterium]